MKTKEELLAELGRIRRAIDKIETVESLATNKTYLGKCFKYRNNFSCPKKPSDYWWLYTEVISFDADCLHVWSFQTDARGEIYINSKEQQFAPMNGHVEIKKSEFETAWKKLKAKVNAA